MLRNSKYKGDADYTFVHTLAEHALGGDAEGYRKEFVQLVRTASLLDNRVKINGGKIIPANE